MEYIWGIEYKCKCTTRVWNYNQVNKVSVMETVLMMMTMMMEIDVEAFKILVPSPPCAVVMMEIFTEAVAMESPWR